MEESVLKCTKKLLQVGDDDSSFDLDIITHINSAFSALDQIGIPTFSYVEDETQTWADAFPYQTSEQLSLIKPVVYLRVRLAFDPPVIASLLDAIKSQLSEAEWWLNVRREEADWVDPAPPDVLVVDGGDPTGP